MIEQKIEWVPITQDILGDYIKNGSNQVVLRDCSNCLHVAEYYGQLGPLPHVFNTIDSAYNVTFFKEVLQGI